MSAGASGRRAKGCTPFPMASSRFRKAVFAAVTALGIAVLLPVAPALSFAASPTLPGHQLLVDQGGLVVFGPAPRATAPCPHLLPLPPGAMAIVKRAVALAMPPLEKQVRLDGRYAQVRVAPAIRSGYSSIAGGCGQIAWARSIVAVVLLPQVEKFSASMSEHTFAVGRVRQGWVLWGYIH